MSMESVVESIPPGYKQTEMGVIPEDWCVLSLVNLVESSRSIRYGIVQPGKFDPHGRYMVRGQDYSNGWVDSSDFFRVSAIVEERYANARIKTGDILITIVGASTGRVAVVPSWLDGANLTQTTARISVDGSKSSSAFCSYVLSSWYGTRQVQNYIKGGAQPGLNCGDIEKFLIPLPPTLAEQEAIATALSDTDALIESLEQLIAKKRQVKQGAMQELLTGKRRLPGFSGEWQTKLLGDLFEFSGGLSASREQLSTEGYCYLHYGDIHTSDKTYIDVKLEIQDIPKLNIPLKKVSFTSLLESGDVVFVDASEDDEGASKHVVVFNDDKIPFISGLHTIVAKSKTNELDYHYRRYCFQTRDVKQQFRFFAVGTKVTGISKANITKIALPVPPLSEQTAIATILSDMDAEITTLEEKLVKTRHIKQGMMQELLTGRIRLV